MYILINFLIYNFYIKTKIYFFLFHLSFLFETFPGRTYQTILKNAVYTLFNDRSLNIFKHKQVIRFIIKYLFF